MYCLFHYILKNPGLFHSILAVNLNFQQQPSQSLSNWIDQASLYLKETAEAFPSLINSNFNCLTFRLFLSSFISTSRCLRACSAFTLSRSNWNCNLSHSCFAFSFSNSIYCSTDKFPGVNGELTGGTRTWAASKIWLHTDRSSIISLNLLFLGTSSLFCHPKNKLRTQT